MSSTAWKGKEWIRPKEVLKRCGISGVVLRYLVQSGAVRAIILRKNHKGDIQFYRVHVSEIERIKRAKESCREELFMLARTLLSMKKKRGWSDKEIVHALLNWYIH